MEKDRLRFSVIMSIYKNDRPEDLRVALDSLMNQTRRPDEIVIVGDGPVPKELEEERFAFAKLVHSAECRVQSEDNENDNYALCTSAKRACTSAERACTSEALALASPKRSACTSATSATLPRIVYLPQEKNRGLGEALAIAAEAATCPYLARMDADDICMPDRFEKQMRCFEEDPTLSVVGGMITEFEGQPENIVTERRLPLTDKEIKRFMKSRCGVNHVTVIFKKEDLMRAGNYRSDYRQEDYYLWARMMKAGCRFRNIPDVVVNVRSGKGQFARRSGWQYYLDHCAIFRYMRREGLISWADFLYVCTVRGIVQLLMPNWLRTWVYQHVLRASR